MIPCGGEETHGSVNDSVFLRPRGVTVSSFGKHEVYDTLYGRGYMLRLYPGSQSPHCCCFYCTHFPLPPHDHFFQPITRLYFLSRPIRRPEICHVVGGTYLCSVKYCYLLREGSVHGGCGWSKSLAFFVIFFLNFLTTC